MLIGNLWGATLEERVELIYRSFCDPSLELTYDQLISITEALLQLRPRDHRGSSDFHGSNSDSQSKMNLEDDIESIGNTEMDISRLLKLADSHQHLNMDKFIELVTCQCKSVAHLLDSPGFQSTFFLETKAFFHQNMHGDANNLKQNTENNRANEGKSILGGLIGRLWGNKPNSHSSSKESIEFES
jgi:hypothetical protein